MFFKPPNEFNINHNYFLKHSVLLSETLQSRKKSNQIPSPPPLESTLKLSSYLNKTINEITDQKIIDDFITPLTFNNLMDFTNYFVNKKTLSKKENNIIKFLIFENVITVKQKAAQIEKKPISFRKKELICLYIYLDRIYIRFNYFMGPSFPSNNKEFLLYKNFIEDAFCVALLKTLVVHKDCQLDTIKDTNPDIYNTYISYDRYVRDDIYYTDYKLYSKKFFE